MGEKILEYGALLYLQKTFCSVLFVGGVVVDGRSDQFRVPDWGEAGGRWDFDLLRDEGLKQNKDNWVPGPGFV